MQQKPTITAGEVATLYGVSRRTIGRKIATGDLTPLMKLPGKTGAHVFDAGQVQRVFEPVQTAPGEGSTPTPAKPSDAA